MAISEQKLRELAAIEPPEFLERIADFLADLTMRTSAVAVLERAQAEEPIGHAGRSALSLGQSIAGRATVSRANRSVDWLYDLLKPYQIGPYELRQFSMWLVRWHDKLAETEVLRERPVPETQAASDLSRPPVARAAAGALAAGAQARGMTREGEAPSRLGGPARTGETRVRRIARSSDGGEVIEYVETPSGQRRTVRIVRREGPATLDAQARLSESRAAGGATREPDVLSRAWRAGHSERTSLSEGSRGAVSAADAELAPAGTRKALTKALWLSNLAMAGTAAGFMMGRSAGSGAMAARIAAPAVLGVAGPSATAMMQPPALSFPLSHPPVSTASWLGASPPAPEAAAFVPMPGGPLASPMLPTLPSTAAIPPRAPMPMVIPVADQPPLRPAGGALEAHRSAVAAALSPAAAEQPVAIVMPDGSLKSLPAHPSAASPRRTSPIPGLIAAGLAGYVIGRLTGGTGGGGSASERWYAEPILGAGPPRVRVYSLDGPGTLTAILGSPGAGPVGTGAAMVGRAPWAGVLLPGVGMPTARDVLMPGRGGKGMPAPLGGSAQFGGGLDPRLGEVTVVSPPVTVASEQAERRGAAVAFDWPVLARSAGQLDAAGLTRLREILPPGAQAIYPALPRESLPTNAVNLRLAPSLLKPLLAQAYGSDAVGIAGSAAATASAFSAPANVPTLGRIVPARRPAGEGAGVIGAGAPTVAGALAEAGGGQARRTPMLDFLGMPVRLAPSLGGRAELRDELAARGVSDQGTPVTAVRPHVFGTLRQHLFPGLQTVHAEPDKSAWRKAAPHFGMRDAEPTTVLAPDSRLKPLGAHSPRPQLGAVAPSGMDAPGGLSSFGILDRMGGRIGGRFGLAPAGPGFRAITPSGPGLGWMGDTARPEGDLGVPRWSWPTGMTSEPDPQVGRVVPSAPIGRPVGHGGWAMGTRDAGPEGFGGRLGSAWGLPSRAVMDSRADIRRPMGVGMPPYGVEAPVRDSDLTSGLAQGAMQIGAPLLSSPELPGMRLPAIGRARMEPMPGPSAFGMALPGLVAGVATQGTPGQAFGHLGSIRAARAVSSSYPGFAGLERMGLHGFRAAPPGSQLIGSPAVIAAPIPVSVRDPMPVPVAAPILAGVRQGPGAEDEGKPGKGRMLRSLDHVRPSVGPLTVPFLAGPTIVSPVPMGIGMPVPVPVPDRVGVSGGPSHLIGEMALPGPSAAPEAPIPQRVSSSVVTRAPERFYVAGDAGPASRRIVVQRASTATGGATGGPHVPSPSTQRAERTPADTQRSSVLASREDGMTANEVHLLANDVWSLLRRRLALEADRRGKW